MPTRTPSIVWHARHNHAIPDVSNPARHVQWQKIEEAKRRLFYSLIKFRLPTSTSRCREPLVFQFLDDMPNRKQIMTGHDNGVITVALREADDGEREKLRVQMGETYRTLLGHFRHEVGHYYWDVLVRDRGLLEQWRSMFGDERHDYSKAMEHYYRTGAPADWRDAFISPYASMHPWEDFAETWAHYIHIVDALEMAHAFGVRLAPRTVASVALSTGVDTNPYRMSSIAAIIEDWLPVCTAVNNLNRAMGQPDLYPFVLSPKAIDKIAYVHRLIRRPL